MSYGTLMVYVGLGRINAELLQIAGDIAERFQAGVIGIAARQPATVSAGEGFVFWGVAGRDRDVVDSELIRAEAEFRAALQDRVAALEWRSASMCASISDYLEREVRSADLLVIDIGADVFNSRRRVDTCDFALRLGRPVVVVPTSAGRSRAWCERRRSGHTEPEGLPSVESFRAFDRAARASFDRIIAQPG